MNSAEIILSPRKYPIVFPCEMSPRDYRKCWKEHDYLESSFEDASFFKYRGNWYYLGDFTHIANYIPSMRKGIHWCGIKHTSYFSAILISDMRDCDDGEFVRIARMYS